MQRLHWAYVLRNFAQSTDMLARVEWGSQHGSALTKVPSVAKAAFGAKSNLAAGCTQNSPGEASMT